jgi:hypothetical protein
MSAVNLLTACLLIGLVACRPAEANKLRGGIRHPVKADLIHPIAPTGDLVIDGMDSSESSLGTIGNELVHAPVIVRLGSATAEPEVFGEVASVLVDKGARTYVLDSRSGEIREFDRDGTVLQRFGRLGTSAGEFARPLSMVMDSAGRLYVGDLSGRILVFKSIGGHYQLDRTLQVNVAPRDMCLLDGKLYLHGLSRDPELVIHVYDLGGRRLGSFGKVYKSPNTLINATLLDGHIACDPEDGLVFYAPKGGLGEIRAYDTRGREVWLTTIHGYRSSDIIETASGFSVSLPESGYNWIHELTYFRGKGLLIQVAFALRADRMQGRDYRVLHTFLLSTKTGLGTFVSDSIWPIVSISPPYLVSSNIDPFPTIRVARLDTSDESTRR